jgi:hypothetical protein
MGKKRSLLVDIEDYDKYLNEKKVSEQNEVIIADKKQSNQRWRQGSVSLSSDEANESDLVVEVRHRDDSGMKIQLFSPQMAEGPCFRYDGDGEAHRNRVEGMRLSESQVTTPHFHRFIDKKTEIAFKTEVLSDEKNAKAIVEDKDFALAHFCQEANVEGQDQKGIDIKLGEAELPLKITKPTFSDPMEGVDFNDW